MSIRLTMAVCCCSWSGMIPASADCPKCKRNCNARIDEGRWQALEKLTLDPEADIARMRRREMIRLGLIVARGKMRAAGDWRIKPSGRTLALTSMGTAARDAYRKMLVDDEKREIVAASVVRHGNLGAQ